MPELPEVETVRRGLQPAMEGARITRLELRRGDLRFPFQPDFAARLQGRLITSLGRRAKYLLADLDSGDVLLMHLGMSGSSGLFPTLVRRTCQRGCPACSITRAAMRGPTTTSCSTCRAARR